MLTDDELRAVESNIFPAARYVPRSRPDFPWHRDKVNGVTARSVNSSQALAIDVFGTLPTLQYVDPVVDAWSSILPFDGEGPWQVEVEHPMRRSILGEPASTQLDAVAMGPRWIVAFECKFTESGGGTCSQVQPLRSGPNKGLRQCSGAYVPQRNPVNLATARCALQPKGVKYWDWIPNLLGYSADEDHSPCPFAGGWYQWMRNVVAAGALAQQTQRRGTAILVYADGPFPIAEQVARPEWTEFVARTSLRPVPVKAVSYQQLLECAIAGCHPADASTLGSLTEWVARKVAYVAAGTTTPWC
jgi:hypothetical protein